MAATDAVILSALTDGVLLVVRSGETPKEAFTRTRDLLSGREVPPARRGAERSGFQRSGLLLLLPLLSVRLWIRLWRGDGRSANSDGLKERVTRILRSRGASLRYLITGGAGFIGSHLVGSAAASRR